MSPDWDNFGAYVSAATQRKRTEAAARKLEKKGRKLLPVQVSGRTIARSFWGKAWAENLERYGDYASRLPRGRSYLRQGAVVDLVVERGVIKGLVCGSKLYEVTVKIDTLPPSNWARQKKECAGQVGSLMDLLQGRLSEPVMEIVTRKGTGLFPEPGAIHLGCSCPDWAGLCKHVAAVLYGVGARLDGSPELLFLLRGVDHLELIDSAAESVTAKGKTPAKGLDEDHLAEIFGIEIDPAPAKSKSKSKSKAKAKPSAARDSKRATRASTSRRP